MSVKLKACLLLLTTLLLSACGSADSARPDQARSSGVEVDHQTPVTPPDQTDETPNDNGEVVPEDPIDEEPVVEEPPVEDPVVEEPPVEDPVVVVPPEPAPLDTNIFFPVIPGMQLYFENSTVPTLIGTGETMDGETVYSLKYEDVLINYFTSTAAEVGIKGLHVLVMNQSTPIYLDLEFATSRTILGDSANYTSTGETTLSITNLPGAYNFGVKLTSTLVASEWISIPGLEPQPARHIRIKQQLSINFIQKQLLLLNFPWLAPIFQPMTYDLWLVPGIGVVKVEMADQASQVQQVVGVPEPQVFTVSRNEPVGGIAPQTLLVNGMPVTDMELQPTVYYRTTNTDWLSVDFDSTGSWRATLTRTNMPRGIHAATVRFGTGDQVQDVTISVMVE